MRLAVSALFLAVSHGPRVAVVQFMTYCAYRGRLETAFLAAELASATAAETRPQPPGVAGEAPAETPKSKKGAA